MAFMARTPEPSAEVTALFPGLAAFARTTFRLHPRAGDPGTGDSSVGGPLLWPAGEPWPACTGTHWGEREVQVRPPGPPSASVEDMHRSALAYALEHYLGRHLSFRPDGTVTAHVPERREPGSPYPLVAVLQLHARDVPDLPFPEGTDVLQVLWCPNRHGFYGPKPYAFWRRAADVTSVLADPPPPVFDHDISANKHYPVPCVLYPEPVTECPDLDDLPEDLRERVSEWEDEQVGKDENGDPFPGPYWTDLSTAPGTKALGWPRWIQGPRPPDCEGCGQTMTHLATVASMESENFDNGAGTRWKAADLPAQFPRNFAPHGLMIGDVGSMYLFTCTRCPNRSLGVNVQY